MPVVVNRPVELRSVLNRWDQVNNFRNSIQSFPMVTYSYYRHPDLNENESSILSYLKINAKLDLS